MQVIRERTTVMSAQWPSTVSRAPPHRHHAAGRFGDTPGRPDEKCSGICAMGHYCLAGSMLAASSPCPIGKYGDLTGVTGVDGCKTCPIGAYCDETGLSEPKSCSDVTEFSTTSEEGATSVSDCVCSLGFFASGTPRVCTACDPSSLNCNDVGSDLSVLKLKPHYWRQSNDSSLVAQCFNPAACVGFQMNATNATLGRRRRRLSQSADVGMVLPSSTYGDGLCAPGHQGPFCAVCVEGYIGGSDSALCKECGGDMSFSIFVAVVAALLLVVVIVQFLRGGQKAADALETAQNVAENGAQAVAEEVAVVKAEAFADGEYGKEDKAKRIAAKGMRWLFWLNAVYQGFKVKIKILVSLYQILSGLGGSFSIPYPTFYGTVTNGLGSIVQVELPSLVPVGCIQPVSYYASLLFSTLWPLALYAIFFVVSKIFYRSGRKAQGSMLIDAIFFFMFLLYPGISTQTMSMFNCVETDDGSSYLRIDLSLPCTAPDGSADPQYVGMQIYAIIMIVIHTIGYPAVYAYLFFKKFNKQLVALREQELADDRIQKLVAVGFDEKRLNKDQLALHDRIDKDTLPPYLQKLTAGYEYRTYWFEIFEMVRKVLLVGVPTMFPDRGGTIQLVWGLLVCFITFGMYMMYAPFVADSDDQLQQMAQLQIFMTLAASIGLRATPPDPLLSNLLGVLLVVTPCISLYEPVREEIMKALACVRSRRQTNGKKELGVTV